MNTKCFLFVFLMLAASALASDVAVTVYNGNLGVVSETRELEFDKGIGRLAFRDVPSRIDVNSVRFEVVEAKGYVAILEQNYAFDLVSPDKMYARYIDEEIELIDKEGKLHSGKLLAYGSGAVTLAVKSGKVKILLMSHITEVSFPSLPEGLITRPTLFWLYNSDRAGLLESRVSYQTSGMNWSAEYIGVLSEDENTLSVSGWASIDNQSGKSFQDATLKLVAGDISRAPAQEKGRLAARSAPEMMTMSGAGFEEKTFFEYHLYTLPRRSTVADKEIKQISLFEPASTPVDKVFVYRPERNPKQVEVALKFKNSSEAGIGMPLPAGRVRLFKADDDGSMILLGEDRISHTPKDEELNLKVGYAFDIAAEDRLMNQNRLSKSVEERDYEIELRNHKQEAVTVRVEKRLHGTWEMISSDLPYRRKDATTVLFEIPVKADETVVMKYQVRFTFK
jgi:hypothetical protein